MSLRLSTVKADTANLVLQGKKKVKQNSKASKQTNKKPLVLQEGKRRSKQEQTL